MYGSTLKHNALDIGHLQNFKNIFYFIFIRVFFLKVFNYSEPLYFGK